MSPCQIAAHNAGANIKGGMGFCTIMAKER